MATKGGKKKKPRSYGHIATAIIPTAGIIAVPSAVQHFPRQKTQGNEEWAPFTSTLVQASILNQMLVPSVLETSVNQNDEYENEPPRKGTPIGRMDGGSDDDDESDDDGSQQRKSPMGSVLKSSVSRGASISESEKRLFGHVMNDEKSTASSVDPGLSSTIHLDAKPKPVAELLSSSTSSSTTTTTTDKKRAGVTITRQHVPPLLLNPAPSQTGPATARTISQADEIGNEAKSTARSSLNDSTTVPVSTTSVTFKNPVVDQIYDLPSTKSQDSTTVIPTNNFSVLDKIVIPPPEEYQQNNAELEKRNQLLNDELRQLRSNNENLKKQNKELLDGLRTSQKLSSQELNTLLRQVGQDQYNDQEKIIKTLQNRYDQLLNELNSTRERYAQDQSQSNTKELKNQNQFLQEHVRRLNAAISEYQKMYPTETLTDNKKDQRKLQSLPAKGPTPIWLFNQKYLAPLFVHYDEKIFEREEFIKNLKIRLNDFHEQIKVLTNENQTLHERIMRTPPSASVNQNTTYLSEINPIKQQAYLVLEENKALQERLDMQTNHLNDLQKSQVQEVSNLNRRLLICQSEKTDAERTLETLRVRNEELRKQYEQLVMDNDHRMHVEDHVREISEMKRLTDELSEKHANEMKLLLRRVQDAETAKRVAQLKLSEYRNDMDRSKGDIKDTKKLNKKLQLRVQTYEKKLELQQLKEERIATLLEKATDDIAKSNFEKENFSTLFKTKEDEINKTRELMTEESKKFIELENRFENFKVNRKEQTNEIQIQMQKQYDNLKMRCSEHEQRIQQLMTLLNEKQVLIDDLNSEKRNLEVDLELIWRQTNEDNKLIREQLRDMHVTR